jgi:UDP-N-acetylmuramate dehydrogenase
MTRDVPLAPFSTLGVGGAAEWLTSITAPDGIVTAHAWSRERGAPLTVLGGGSNVVIADAGIRGLVLHNRLDGMAFWKDSDDTLVTAGAGEPCDNLVAACVARGLAGVECLSGIPGGVGGTPIQNVGAYGQQVADTVETVTAFDVEDGAMRTLPSAECRFAYRTSRFKTDEAGRWIVCAVTFRLRAGDPLVSYPDVRMQLEQRGIASPTVADVREAVLAVRRRKGMVIDAADADTHSVGSFFVNPILTDDHRERIASASGQPVPGFGLSDGRVKVPAAWLIEHAGFTRGTADGAAGISSKHTLALINRGGATAADIVRLAVRIKRTVADRFGVLLRPEPVFLGFAASPDLDYLRTDHH